MHTKRNQAVNLIRQANKRVSPCQRAPTRAFETGGGRTGYYFPHDEFYDDGLREAIRYVTEHAPAGATIAHETPGVVRYYAQRYGRTDLQSRVISDHAFKLSDAPAASYFIVQRGRTYFENQEKLKELRARYRKVFEVTINGASAVEVYTSP